MHKKPLIFSFFSGAGFLDLGFELAGYEIGYVNELHPPFIETYRYSRQLLGISSPVYGYYEGDIANLLDSSHEEQLRGLVQHAIHEGKLVGFIGGPPCPDFSVGGKNRGREGDNGKLSATYVELICRQRPHFFLFENVKGLWRTKKHRQFFDEMKQKLHAAGYITTERLINAIEYGAPQDRERIILIGFQKDIIDRLGIDAEITNSVLPDGVFPWEKYIKFPAKDVFSYPWPEVNRFSEGEETAPPEKVPDELTVEYWFKRNDVKNHPNSEHCFTPRAGLARFKTIEEGDVSKKSYKRLHRWRYSPTACYGNNEVHLHPYQARRITVAEALAIQSLPKEFCIPSSLSLSNMFKTVGNGVPFLASKEIARTILDFLGE